MKPKVDEDKSLVGVGLTTKLERAYRANVDQYLAAFIALPITQAAVLAKKSFGSFLQHATGLSRSRIKATRLASLRASTVARARQSSLDQGRAAAIKNGWAGEAFDESVATAPTLHTGEPAPLAQWLHFSQVSEFAPLPLSIAYALEIDEFLAALSLHVAADDPLAFRDAVLEFLAFEVVVDSSDQAGAVMDDWLTRTSWAAIDAPFKEANDSLILHLYAAIDVEWGGRYFQTLAPAPVFLWVAPRMSPDLDLAKPPKRLRNLVHRPVRRFLEVGYAYAEFVYFGKWPKAAPGRSALAGAMGLDDVDIGNFFDGTRKLGFTEVQTYWQTMVSQDTYQAKRKGFLAFPTMLATIAIVWQELMVKTGKGSKFKSAIVLDEDEYRRRWQLHRDRWATELGAGEKDWPEWLTDQSLLPSPASN
jgi:hypothetical protein